MRRGAHTISCYQTIHNDFHHVYIHTSFINQVTCGTDPCSFGVANSRSKRAVMAVATERMARAPLRARTEDAEDAEEAVEPKDAEDFAAGGGEGTMGGCGGGGGRRTVGTAAPPDSASEPTRESARYCSRCKL